MVRRVRTKVPTVTLPAFNNGEPLTVVQLEDGSFGIIDVDTLSVWVEYELTPRKIPFRHLKRIEFPGIPDAYGKFVSKSIGGVSRTIRRNGTLRAKTSLTCPVTLFATNMSAATEVERALSDVEGATVGDSECVPGEGYVAEVVVHDARLVDHVAARLARAGIAAVFEDDSQNALQSHGVERLDRIDAKVSNRDDEDRREEADDYGLGRGEANWLMPWVPDHWQLPITWDYMVENVPCELPLARIPMPLRQHVAKRRLELLVELGEATSETANAIRRHIPAVRNVSAALSDAQSKQVITTGYLLAVERVHDPTVLRATRLIQFRYAFERGYFYRYLGKYQQRALYLGNGIDIRSFKRLAQYDPHRLPATVLNKLITKSGKLRGRGSKGSRSKYVAKADRYLPQKKLSRTGTSEQTMRMLTQS